MELLEVNPMRPKAVFVDRDDTLAKDVPYCNDPDKFVIFPDVPVAIRRLNDAGFLVIVITNQSGINRGYFTEETLSKIHERLLKDVSVCGGHIDDIFYCPHTPEENCDCRKPKIGLGLRAVEKYDIDVSGSYMIGDHDKDIEFARRLGCRRGIKVGDGKTFTDAVDEILADEGQT